MYFKEKECRIYAACGVSQTPISGYEREEYILEYKIWLQKDGNKVPTSGEGAVPFIFGPVYHSDKEVDSIFSSENVYTNITNNQANINTLAEYYNNGDLSGFRMLNLSRNSPDYYFAGVGHKDDAVWGKYGLTSGNGELEFRMGYRAYSLQYVQADGAQIQDATIPSKEMIPVPDINNPGKPSDKAGSIEPVAGNKITKFILKDVFYGDETSKLEVPATDKYITLEGGTTIDIGKEIKPSQIPLIKMDKNVVIEIHTISEASSVQLNYHFKNDQIPKQTGHTEGDTNLVENYKKYNVGDESTKDPTSNGSLKPDVVIKGRDGKDYKLIGWFEDEDLKKPYSFNENLTASRDIYAKWEEVVDPPKPNPDPKKDDSDNNNNNNNNNSSGSAPETPPENIRVDFVSQVGIAPLPQIKNVGEKATNPGTPFDPATLQPGTVISGYRFEGWFLDPAFALPYNFDTQLTQSIILYAKWVRVSPKTGDTTIPPMYYILATLATAATGVLIYEKKKKRDF